MSQRQNHAYHSPTIRRLDENGFVYEMHLTAGEAVNDMFAYPDKNGSYFVKFGYNKHSMRVLDQLGRKSGLTLNQFHHFFELIDKIVRENNTPGSEIFTGMSKNVACAIYEMMVDVYVALEISSIKNIDHDPECLLEDDLTEQQQQYLDIVHKNETPAEYERIKSIYVNSTGFHWKDYSPYDALADIDLQAAMDRKRNEH